MNLASWGPKFFLCVSSNVSVLLMVAMCSIHNGRVRDAEELNQARGLQSICCMTVWFLDIELEAI